jgi:hypothetical protein
MKFNKYENEDKVHEFTFSHLLVKLTSRKLWFCAAWMFIAVWLAIKDGDHDYITAAMIIAGIITATYLFGDILLDHVKIINIGKVQAEFYKEKANEQEKTDGELQGGRIDG